MNINQLKTTAGMAHLQRTACTLIPGIGYVRLGDHRMPEVAINPPSACLPPEGTPDLAIASFIVPGTTEPSIKLQWKADLLLWMPLSPIAGNRLAYRPAYLAAIGWKLYVDG